MNKLVLLSTRNSKWQTRLMGIFACMVIISVLFSSNCFAKKSPTFQVWGGSVFTYGNIDLSDATSRVVGGSKHMFSSWVEYGVFANGYVGNGLASGAASSGGSIEDVPGVNGDYCKYRAPMSFANYSTDDFRLCPSGEMTGTFGYNYPKFNMKSSVEEIRKTGVDVGGENTTTTIPSASVPSVITQTTIVATYGDVNINGNIVYNTSDKVYYSLEEVPKLFIYAKNINISCGVGRLDAVLFASGNIDTCYDGPKKGNGTPDYDAVPRGKEYSKQLVINGAIIAGQVLFRRTYGAVDLSNTTDQTGGSVVSKCQDNVKYCASIPAEIINYDYSIIVTGKNSNTGTSKTNLVTVYQRELAPRY